MSDSLHDSIYQAIASIRLVDPHTHINPHSPASSTLADLLGYHYYTELAHSAGMEKDQIEEQGLPPRELVHRLVSNLWPIENTVQYRWLVEICRMFFGFEGDRIDSSNWEQVYDSAERQMALAEWPQIVLDQSNVEAVFLTNDFDDPLSGFDTDTYIPCLRTDDLVFHLEKLETRQRLEACAGIELDGSLTRLRDALKQRFEHFVGHGARACAISLPPTFEPVPVSDGRAATALDHVLQNGPQADASHRAALSRRIFWTLAELCDEYRLPFDLMIGVNRGVYADGVYQGQDLFDSRVSLIQYRELFNAFPSVKFPISVLASVTNQELVSYAWIFPNVITNGHWWYSNTPSFIARDAAARLEAVPQTKQIAYYSDAYKLEFVWPKFDMYRRVLAGILAEQFVKARGFSEERAIELGRQVLRDNVDEIFPRPPRPDADEGTAKTWDDIGEPAGADLRLSDSETPAVAGTSAALAAEAIGMVEVDETTPADDSSAFAETTDLQPPAVDAGGGGGEDLDVGFATIIEDSASQPENEPIAPTPSDTVPIETVVEEQGGQETVRIHELESSESHSQPFESEPALDPLPSDEEIQAVDVDDVQLTDPSPEKTAVDASAIEAEAEPLTLDVGDLLDDGPATEQDSQPDTESAAEMIRPLRGEQSFQPDDDSLRLQPDPLTGELTFPVPSEENESAPGGDAGQLAETIDLPEPAEIAETIDLPGPAEIAETIDLPESDEDAPSRPESAVEPEAAPERQEFHDEAPHDDDSRSSGDPPS